jgi:hypothetical protein
MAYYSMSTYLSCVAFAAAKPAFLCWLGDKYTARSSAAAAFRLWHVFG